MRTAPWLVIAALTLCSTARANGRFPEAQLIESVPGSGGRTLYLRTTFGILVSRDAGKSWRWICERALGYEGQWDPPIAVTRDGRLWVGLEDGLVSTRDGCTVDRAIELDGATVKDLTTDGLGETVWAITGAPTKRSFVWRRRPGKAFEQLAGMDETNLMTIEVAPSDATRVYLSGQSYATIRGAILRSDDGGATFRDAGGGAALVADGPLFIGMVDPRDPSRLMARHLHAKGSDLYLSRDGGRTLTNVLSMKSAMFGFAKSGDGRTIWAGSGLPEHGIFRSTDRGEHFTGVSYHGVLCLHAAAPDALFVCENAAAYGANAIAVARDGSGKTVVPLARFSDVEGPLACGDASSAASLCAGAWPAVQASFAAPPDAGEPPPARPERPDAASAGSAARAGTNGKPSAGRSSCACDALGAPPPSSAWPGVVGCGLLALIARGYSRRRRGSKSLHRVIYTAQARSRTYESNGPRVDARDGSFADDREEHGQSSPQLAIVHRPPAHR